MTHTTIPAVDVRVDGRSLPDEVLQRLISVRIASRLSHPTQCEFAFRTHRGSAAEHDRCPLGAALEIRLAQVPDPLFEGEVTCVELVHGPDSEATTRIRGYDRLHRLRKRQQLRVFNDVTAAGLAATLVGDLDIDVDAEESGPRLQRVVQHGQRDLELLVEVANRAGLHAVLHGRRLRLLTLDGVGEAVPLELGTSLLQARVEANLDRGARRYTALGWHPQRAELIAESATSARSGRRIPLEPDPAAVGSEGELVLVDQPGRSPDEVAALAQAALDTSAGHTVTISGIADGDVRLMAGNRVEVRGLAEPVQGSYVLCEAVHTVDAAGYQTAFSTEPPAPRPVAAGTSLTLGRVTAVDDPDQLGRVQVCLPAHGDPDVGWLGVLCPGAGPDRGIVALPDVDDTVLVALPHGGPADGVVLGSLYGTVTPFDSGVSDGAVQRWSMHTRGGQSVVVDDGERSLRLENEAGSFLELRPDLLRLRAVTDMVIEAPGKAITVRARSVDFEQASGEEGG